ncbi:MAG: Ig-like domain-containing protein, partial [Marinobacter sp.]|uniref:Ig-like domain-containing protein n=5 Tax=Pseudomonadota TaxID=1224 RepID=UPI0032648550
MLTGDTLTFEAGGNEANVAKGNATIGLELADTPSGAGMTEPGDGSPVLSGPKSMNGVIAKTSVGSINLSGSTQGGISGPIAPRERFAAILRKTARISTCKTGFPLRAFFTIGLLLTALSLSQERALAQTVTESCAGYTGTIPGLAWPGSYSTDQYLTSAGTCAASPAAGDLVTVLQATSTDGLNISIVGEIEGTRVGPICGGVVGGSGRYLFAINTNHACTMTRWVGNRNVTVTFSTAANISNVSGGTADFQVVFGTINYTSVADTTPPTAVLSGLAPLIGLAGDSVTLTFSEEIQGVSLSDLALTNLTASNLNTSDNTVFTFDVVPVADGPIAINLPANSATDLAGNGNQVSNTVSGTGDATPPTVTIAPLSGPVAGEYTAAITLSEASTDFNLADLTLTNATATLSGSGTSYTATLTPVADGRVALSVAAGTFSDAVGNTNTAASNEVTSTYDTTAPTVSIGPLTGPVAGEYTAVITLSETSTDFNLADLTLTNATATLSGSGTSYTATLTPVADGPVALSVAAGTFSDSGGNTNTAASNEVIVTYDTT